MRPEPLLRTLAIAAILVLSARLAVGAPDPAGADEAFDAGENERALALYDEILVSDPANVHALLRSGMLLSWDKKYDDALMRYDRALTRDPSQPQVLLERGKVLLWSRRYDEAVDSFRKVLAKNPNEPWALCGTGQAYAWRGRNAEARPYFERAVAADPTLAEAKTGLARVELEEGDTWSAHLLADQLAADHPDDPEVKALQHDIDRARSPWVQIGYDHSDDSDDNRMNTYRAEGGLALPERLDLRLGYAHSDLHGPVPANADAEGSADTLYGVLGWRPRPRQRVEFRAGAIRVDDSTGDERTTAVGGVSYEFPMASWTGRAGVAFDPFLYSPEILDHAIDITSYTFSAYGLAAPRVRVETNAGFGDFSDGNARVNADAGAWYVWRWSSRSLLVGGVVRYLDYSDDLNDGYFDPSNLVAAVASVRSDGTFGSSAWSYEAAAEAGAQSYTFNGAKTSGKPLFNLYGLIAHPLGHGLSFQIFANAGNSSTASGPGYNSLAYGARLRWSIGG